MNSPLLFSDDSIIDVKDILEASSSKVSSNTRSPFAHRQLRLRSRSSSPLLFSPTKQEEEDVKEVEVEIIDVKLKQNVVQTPKIISKKKMSKTYPLFMKPIERKRRSSDIENDSPLPQHLVAKLTSPSFVQNYDRKALEVFDPKFEDIDLSRPVRKKELRTKMHGYECPCCKPYYDQLNLSPESRKQRVNQVSRHRAFPGQEMPPTPPRYWDLKFPSVEERKHMGQYVVTTSPVYKMKEQKHTAKKEKSKAVRKVF